MRKPSSTIHQARRTEAGPRPVQYCLLALVLSATSPGWAENVPDSDQSQAAISPQVQSSPIAAPEANDLRYVVDDAPGLDTGCTFRSGGPLVFDIPVTRHMGDLASLQSSGAIDMVARLAMPAFDVDVEGAPGAPPERDRVLFNGEVVEGEFLTGGNGIWKLNAFRIPVDAIDFPDDPGETGSVEPAMNRVEIHIDVASPSGEENWCTAIDWAMLEVEQAARPHLLIHGIFSEGETWTGPWTQGLEAMGIPFATIDMGRLDSIGSNADKIADKVDELRERWGVDAVNLTAHSKGGIDSRHFVEGNEDAVRLIQIGTPNAGAVLADYIQAGTLRFLGPVGNIIANGLAGGVGGYQLTTPYMNTYNRFHGFNPRVRYVALGGVYSGGGWVDSFLNRVIPGDDDTIVGLSSVHALDFTENLVFSSTGSNEQAKHVEQTRSGQIFDLLRPITGSPQGSVSAGSLPEERPVPTGVVSDTLEPGETQSRTIPVDGEGSAAFSLIYGTGDLDLVLVSPSGVRIDPNYAESHPGIEFSTDETLEGFRIEGYGFDTAEPGEWTAEVTAASLPQPPGTETYFLSAWLEEPAVRQEVHLDGDSRAVGDPLVVYSRLKRNGAPLTGATVSATVRTPDDTIADFPLADDGVTPDETAGDGIYSGGFGGTEVPGMYRVRIDASGGSPSFRRSDLLLAPMAVSATSISGHVTSEGVDSNGNGLFDVLAVDIPVEVSDQATYLATAELVGPEDQRIDSAIVRRELGAGSGTLRLEFDGRTIFNHRIDGPYQIRRLRLAEEDQAGDPLPLESLDGSFETRPFEFREFEHPAIFLPGTGEDVAVDTDGNGLFDRLDVTVDVDLVESGLYEWSARLVDENGNEIGFDTARGSLSAQADTLSFAFDGVPIGENGVDGPYQLVDLIMFGAGQSAVQSRVYTTGDYEAGQFEGFNQPPVCHDAAADPGFIWPANHALVPVAIEGIFDPDGDEVTVTVTGIMQDEPVNGSGDGHTAPDGAIVEGAARVRAERAGNGDGRVYHVHARAEDVLGASCERVVKICVPHDQSDTECGDGGPIHDSLQQ